MGHTLSLLESSPYPSGAFLCNLCREEGCGPVYHCSDCDFDIHVACAAMTTQQTHFSHSYHPLYLTHCGSHRRKCSSCGLGIHTWSFRCERCDYDMHSMCVRAPRFLMHTSHAHPLALSKAEGVPGTARQRCDGCKMPVGNFFYRCDSCHYNLHQVCATVPSKIKHVKHHAHMLALMESLPGEDDLSLSCHECAEQVKGWHFRCGMCNFNLHTSCANLAHELPHFDGGVNTTQKRSNATTSKSPFAGRANPRDNSGTAIPRSIAHTPLPSNSLGESSATAPTSPFIGHTISHDHVGLNSRIATKTLLPSDKDWEAVERVIRFAREVAKSGAAAQGNSSSDEDDHQYHCPTCLEAFDLTNPRMKTSCGHGFHLACILQWMERSTNCPLCRKHFKIFT